MTDRGRLLHDRRFLVPRILAEDGSTRISDLALYDQGGIIEWATAAALAVAAGARGIVGDLDESSFLYSEEVDYLRRVRESGLFVAYDRRYKWFTSEESIGEMPVSRRW